MRTLSEVINIKDERIIDAEKFFRQNTEIIFKKRYELEEAFQNNSKLIVCPICRQPVKIRGKRDGIQSMHFAHIADNSDCPIKTGKKYSKDQILRMKYNGQKESNRHFILKNLIAQQLSKDSRFSNIKIDKRFNGICKEWRRPDVAATFNCKNIVFEIQLSTTFLNVIAERNIFYRNNDTYIIWIFANNRQNINNMRFTEKDIFYPNHHNAFFIDEKFDQDKFELFCGYERPVIQGKTIKNEWNLQKVAIDDLIFDSGYQVYWYDYDKEKKNLEKQVAKIEAIEFGKSWEKLKNQDEQIEFLKIFLDKIGYELPSSHLYQLKGLLDCLYSLKFRKVIHYKYSKVVQVLHQYFEKEKRSESHFGEYIFKGINAYDMRNQILQEDGTGKFVNRAKDYKKQNYELSHKFDFLLNRLFPELFFLILI